MFGAKKEVQGANLPVSDYDDPAIRSYFRRGQWVTLALSRVSIPFRTDDNPYAPGFQAFGVVHFDYGHDRLIRTALRLVEGAADDGRAGDMSFGYWSDERQPYAILNVTLYDRRKRLETAIKAAFQAAALSHERFVHLDLTREKDDRLEEHIEHLKVHKTGADQKVTAVELAEKLVLPHSPKWSWVWSGEHL